MLMRVVFRIASALAIYRIAHRYLLPELASLALCHIISTLTLRTAFPLLLSTHLWPDLHSAIKVRSFFSPHFIHHRLTRVLPRITRWRTTMPSAASPSSAVASTSLLPPPLLEEESYPVSSPATSAEVGEGLWEHGGDVLLEFTLQLQPAWRGSLA